MSSHLINEDSKIGDSLRRELLGYKNQVNNMRFWLLFYVSGIAFVIKLGNLNWIGKLSVISFFFIPNYLRYRKLFRDQKKKIYLTLIDSEIKKIKISSNEVNLIEMINEFDLFLNNNL